MLLLQGLECESSVVRTEKVMVCTSVILQTSGYWNEVLDIRGWRGLQFCNALFWLLYRYNLLFRYNQSNKMLAWFHLKSLQSNTSVLINELTLQVRSKFSSAVLHWGDEPVLGENGIQHFGFYYQTETGQPTCAE